MSVDTAVLTLGPHHRTTEFVFDSAQGIWLKGTCGPTALAMAAWNATNSPHDVLSVYRLMRAHGLCDITGASTPAALNSAAGLLGLHVAEFRGYGTSDAWPGWSAFLDVHGGKEAVVLELSHGQALRDSVSGCGENATDLRYHYICVYGPGTYNGQAGMWCADGDNFAVGDVLQHYPLSVLAAAQPCAAIAISIPGSGGASMVPNGWHDDGTTLAAPNGVGVTLGFRDFILTYPGGWPAMVWPAQEFDGENNSNLCLSVGLHWQPGQPITVRSGELPPPPPPVSNPVEHAKAAALDGLMALYGVHGS